MSDIGRASSVNYVDSAATGSVADKVVSTPVVKGLLAGASHSAQAVIVAAGQAGGSDKLKAELVRQLNVDGVVANASRDPQDVGRDAFKTVLAAFPAQTKANPRKAAFEASMYATTLLAKQSLKGKSEYSSIVKRIKHVSDQAFDAPTVRKAFKTAIDDAKKAIRTGIEDAARDYTPSMDDLGQKTPDVQASLKSADAQVIEQMSKTFETAVLDAAEKAFDEAIAQTVAHAGDQNAVPESFEHPVFNAYLNAALVGSDDPDEYDDALGGSTYDSYAKAYYSNAINDVSRRLIKDAGEMIDAILNRHIKQLNSDQADIKSPLDRFLSIEAIKSSLVDLSREVKDMWAAAVKETIGEAGKKAAGDYRTALAAAKIAVPIPAGAREAATAVLHAKIEKELSLLLAEAKDELLAKAKADEGVGDEASMDLAAVQRALDDELDASWDRITGEAQKWSSSASEDDSDGEMSSVSEFSNVSEASGERDSPVLRTGKTEGSAVARNPVYDPTET